MSKVRLGFVGVGNMGQCAHLAQYATLENCQIVALAEMRPELSKAVAARYGIPHVYKDHAAMLAAERLDGIVTAQQFCFLGQTLPSLLATGLPVITEKPIGQSVAVGEKILAAEKKIGGKLYVAYHKRSDPATMAAKSLMAEWQELGKFGQLRYIRATMPPGDWIAGGFNALITSNEPYPALTPDEAEYADKNTNAKYNNVVNYYIHQVNLIRHLLGEDYSIRYADPAGVLLAGLSQRGVPVLLEMQPYSTTVDWQESVLIAFERGWMKIELLSPLTINQPGRLTVFEDPGNGSAPRWWSPLLPMQSAMRQQAVNFLNAVRGETTPLCTAQDAVKDLKTAREYLNLFLAGVK